jgi:hypothetical protein
MKKQIILSIIVFITIASVIFIGCKKENSTSSFKPVYSTVDGKLLDKLVQDYYQSKFQYLFETNSEKSNAIKSKLSSFYYNDKAFNECVKTLDDQKQNRAVTNLVYTNYNFSTLIEKNTIKEDLTSISLRVHVNFSFSTNLKDVESGEPITPTGIETFDLKLHKQGDKLFIESEESVTPNVGKDNELSMGDYMPSYTDNSPKYSYSATTAAKFATDHWNDVSNVTGYTDYTSSGGDCTNFLSWCLKKGGWVQNNSWFFISNGSSGNDMQLYKRSPSWTSANYFYQYITATGTMYQGSGGNNRVTSKFSLLYVPATNATTATWTTFYNTVKVIKKGDIIQLGTVPITHSMLVTKTSTKAPYVYVTYRNASGYSPYKDRPINELNGRYLNGFYVKTSGS